MNCSDSTRSQNLPFRAPRQDPPSSRGRCGKRRKHELGDLASWVEPLLYAPMNSERKGTPCSTGTSRVPARGTGAPFNGKAARLSSARVAMKMVAMAVTFPWALGLAATARHRAVPGVETSPKVLAFSSPVTGHISTRRAPINSFIRKSSPVDEFGCRAASQRSRFLCRAEVLAVSKLATLLCMLAGFRSALSAMVCHDS